METLRTLVNPVPLVSAETDMATVLALLCASPSACVAVVSGGRPVGLISAQDALRWQMDASLVGYTYVRDAVACRPPLLLPQDTPLSLAFQQLETANLRQILVVDEAGACLGSVTQDALVAALAVLPEQCGISLSRRQLEHLLAHLPVCLYTLQIAADGTPQFECLSPQWCERVFSCTTQEPAARMTALCARIYPEDSTHLRQVLTHTRETGQRFTWEGRLQDGATTRWLHLEAQPHTSAGSTIWDGVAYEITDRRNAEEKLRLAAAVFEHTLEGVIVTNAKILILAVNPAFSQITGYTEAEMIGKSPRILQSGKQSDAFYRLLWRELRRHGQWQGEIWNRRKNGEVYPEWLMINAVRNAAATVTHYVGVFFDLSRLKRSEERLEQLAHYDPLTQLPNRLLLKARLNTTLAKAQRSGVQAAVLFLDLDRFKQVNDNLGHTAGDELLQTLAQRLARRLRAVDTLARLGGDEFVVVLEDVHNEDSVAQVARTLLEVLHEPVMLSSGHQVQLGASIGISLYPRDGQTSAELIQHADSAMYLAKERGRNTYCFYSSYLTQAAQLRLQTETQLRTALEQDKLTLHYQPLVRVEDGQIIGAEALLRWLDVTGKVIAPPAHFIPIAEESGLINQIGAWALRHACQQAAQWAQMGLPLTTLTVNLSTRQFIQSDLAAQIGKILTDTGLNASTLELEITENALMSQGNLSENTLLAISRLGVRLSIDDFGTGYSSLAYLKRLAINKLKIDKSFIRDIPHDASATEIVATIIAMARALKLEVLAEGVETAAQLTFLRQRRCDSYQGYLFSPPLPAAEFLQYLQRRSG